MVEVSTEAGAVAADFDSIARNEIDDMEKEVMRTNDMKFLKLQVKKLSWGLPGVRIQRLSSAAG